MLFPFRFKTWLKVGFIGWLAGATSSSGCNLRLPSSSGGSGGGSSNHDVEQTIRVFLHEHLLLVILLTALVIALSLALIYLASRFRFILFDTVLRRDAAIGRGWGLYGRQANRYFGFWICFMIASGIALALILGLPLWRAYKSGVLQSNDPFPALLGYLVPMVLGVLLFLVILAVISSLINDFMVPLLALDSITIGAAGRGFAG